MEENFGEILKRLREERNLSQQQLATRLFVSRSSIANWENSRRIPDMTLIIRIARFFNVDISMLADACDTDIAPPEVMILDDEAILLSGSIGILSEVMPDANITGFSKVSEALDYARNTPVSIAFLDIELGKTNGLKLTEKLLEIYPMTNVIYLTAYPDYAISAWTTAASGFLVKPLKPGDVRIELKKLRFPVKGLKLS